MRRPPPLREISKTRVAVGQLFPSMAFGVGTLLTKVQSTRS